MPLATLEAPGRKDLVYVLGDSFQRTFTITEDGAALDLTGYEAEASVFDRHPIDSHAVEVATFTAEIPAPATDGQVTISLTATQTASAAMPVHGGWRLRLILTADPDDNTHTVLEGEFSRCR